MNTGVETHVPSTHSSFSASVTAPPSQRLAGWLPVGMIDWPGRVSSTVFLSGCQLRCPYCHNPNLIAARERDAIRVWAEMLTYLDRRREWIDGVVITGGEPTLDPGITALLEFLKANDVQTKLDTNGMEPLVLKSLLYRNLVDFVALDVKTVPSGYGAFTPIPDAEQRIMSSIRIVKESGISHEFRTTCYPGLVDGPQIEAVAGLLAGGNRYVLQQFRSDVTLEPEAARRQSHDPEWLSSVAADCCQWIPTTTRGV